MHGRPGPQRLPRQHVPTVVTSQALSRLQLQVSPHTASPTSLPVLACLLYCCCRSTT